MVASIYYDAMRIPFLLSSAGGFLLGTFLLSPDLDLFDSRPNKMWGPFRYVFWPYAKFFRHRGMSHIPILGSLSRLLYLMIVLGILISLFTLAFEYFRSRDALRTIQSSADSWMEWSFSLLNLMLPYWDYFLFACFGLILSDLIHLLTDKLYSSLKRLRP